MCKTSYLIASENLFTIDHQLGSNDRCLNRIQLHSKNGLVGSMFYYYNKNCQLINCECLSIYETNDIKLVIKEIIKTITEFYPISKNLFIKTVVPLFKWRDEYGAMPQFCIVRLILGQLDQLQDIHQRRPNQLFLIKPFIESTY